MPLSSDFTSSGSIRNPLLLFCLNPLQCLLAMTLSVPTYKGKVDYLTVSNLEEFFLLVPSGGGEGKNIRKTKLNCKREKDVFLLENRFFDYKYFFYKLWLLFLWSSRVEFEINWGRWDTIFFNFFILRPSRTSHCRPYMIHRKRFSIRNLSIQSGRIRSSGSVWQAGDPKDVICISSNII